MERNGIDKQRRYIQHLKEGKLDLSTFFSLVYGVPRKELIQRENRTDGRFFVLADEVEDEPSLWFHLMYASTIRDIKYLVELEGTREVDALFCQIQQRGNLLSGLPIVIAAVSSKNAEELIKGSLFEKNSWITGIEIHTFSNRVQALEFIRRVDYMATLNVGHKILAPFESPEERRDCAAKLMSEVFQRYVFDLDTNIFLAGFYRNLMRMSNPHQVTLLCFDFIEFQLQLIHYYLLRVRNQEDLPSRILSFSEHARAILALSQGTPYGDVICDKKYPCSDSLELSYYELEKYTGIKVEGKELNFYGVIGILQMVRNFTRGHGMMIGKSLHVLFQVVFEFALYVSYFLEMSDFHMEIREDKFYMRKGQAEWFEMSPFFVVDGGFPCPCYEARKTREYINYFAGEYLVPDII